MTALAYRMDVHTTEQIAAQDPFGGHGRKLVLPLGMSQGEQTAYMEERCPHGGWVIAHEQGHAWVDVRTLTGK